MFSASPPATNAPLQQVALATNATVAPALESMEPTVPVPRPASDADTSSMLNEDDTEPLVAFASGLAGLAEQFEGLIVHAAGRGHLSRAILRWFETRNSTQRSSPYVASYSAQPDDEVATGGRVRYADPGATLLRLVPADWVAHLSLSEALSATGSSLQAVTLLQNLHKQARIGIIVGWPITRSGDSPCGHADDGASPVSAFADAGLFTSVDVDATATLAAAFAHDRPASTSSVCVLRVERRTAPLPLIESSVLLLPLQQQLPPPRGQGQATSAVIACPALPNTVLDPATVTAISSSLDKNEPEDGGSAVAAWFAAAARYIRTSRVIGALLADLRFSDDTLDDGAADLLALAFNGTSSALGALYAAGATRSASVVVHQGLLSSGVSYAPAIAALPQGLVRMVEASALSSPAKSQAFPGLPDALSACPASLALIYVPATIVTAQARLAQSLQVRETAGAAAKGAENARPTVDHPSIRTSPLLTWVKTAAAALAPLVSQGGIVLLLAPPAISASQSLVCSASTEETQKVRPCPLGEWAAAADSSPFVLHDPTGGPAASVGPLIAVLCKPVVPASSIPCSLEALRATANAAAAMRVEAGWEPLLSGQARDYPTCNARVFAQTPPVLLPPPLPRTLPVPVFVLSGDASDRRRAALERLLQAHADWLTPVTWVAPPAPLPPGGDYFLDWNENAGQIAVLLGHALGVIPAILRAGVEAALVLEDDARLHSRAGARIAAARDWMLSGAGEGGRPSLLRVGYFPDPPFPGAANYSLRDGFGIIEMRQQDNLGGTAGYLVSRAAAAAICAASACASATTLAEVVNAAKDFAHRSIVADYFIASVTESGVLRPPAVIDACEASLHEGDVQGHAGMLQAAAARHEVWLEDYAGHACDVPLPARPQV
jgi:hypothetical protein